MGEIHSIDEAAALAETALTGDTPTLRLFSLLELIATKNQLFTLQGLVELTGTPKPTLHRMLQQLEGAGLLIRENNGRHYVVGARLRRMAESLLLNDTHHGARHSVLRSLVEELGESCNLTALSGDEILYVDRVETLEPLRFTLQPGSRVPVHCSASGKMILSQLAPVQRRRLLEAAPLKQYTPTRSPMWTRSRNSSSRFGETGTQSTIRSSCLVSSARPCWCRHRRESPTWASRFRRR